jgi:hypothetical protein
MAPMFAAKGNGDNKEQPQKRRRSHYWRADHDRRPATASGYTVGTAPSRETYLRSS